MSKNNNHGVLIVLIISLVISFVIYNFLMTNIFEPTSYYTDSSSTTDSITDVSYTEDEVEEKSVEEVTDQSSQIVGSWKYYVFPGKCDATQYLTFRSDGTFEMYQNPGAVYATHCQGKQSGTYSFDGTNLILNYMNARWPYTLTWTDGNSFNLTYVSQVNTCTRVSDDEYNMYVNG